MLSEITIWWNFTTPLEPILVQNAKNCEPRRLARQAVLRSTQKTLCIFFVISPP